MTAHLDGDWRTRFKSALASRFALRIHMTLILLTVFSIGVITSRLLHAGGVAAMGLRYFVAACVAYVAFFLLVRAWLACVSDTIRHVAPTDHEVDTAVDTPAAEAGCAAPTTVYVTYHEGKVRYSTRQSSDAPWSRYMSESTTDDTSRDTRPSWSSSPSSSDDRASAVLGAIIGAIVLAILGSMAYLVWEAPVILGDAAVEIVLAGALARSTRGICSSGWRGSVLRATWGPAAIIMAAAGLGGWLVQGSCPEAQTMPAALEQCVWSSGDQPDSTYSPRRDPP